MKTIDGKCSYPCPWCGYYDLFVYEKGMGNIQHLNGDCFVVCDHCGATGPKAKTKDEAITKWNECVDADDSTAEEIIVQKENDNVNHPEHYCMGKIETIEAIVRLLEMTDLKAIAPEILSSMYGGIVTKAGKNHLKRRGGIWTG